MTKRFILDENVVILAQKGESDSGEHDATCLRLLSEIIRICHTLVLDVNLWRAYLRQLDGLQSDEPRAGVRILPVLANAFRMDVKMDLRSNAPAFPEEGSIPSGSRDDTQLVRLAVETGDTIVTTDRPLREDLNACGVAEAYNLQLLSPAEALEQL